MNELVGWVSANNYDHQKVKHVILLLSGPKDMFDYEGFFESKIEEKKQDSSYRIFKRVARLGSSFPMAEEHTKERKKISVWCSNDYLGMSWHPAVQSAVV